MADSVSPKIALGTLAKLLDLTERRVNQLAKDNVIPRATRGEYELIPSVHGYIKYLRAMANDGSLSLTDERTRLTRAQAEAEEIRVRTMKGEFLHADTAQQLWEQVVGAFRARMLGLPTKLAPQVIEQKTLLEIQEVLSHGVHDALTELGRLNPADYLARDQTRDSPAETDGEPVGGSAPTTQPRKQRRAGPVVHRTSGVPAGDHGRGKRSAG